MRLTPTPPVIGEDDGFTKENDIFELRPFGERLANLISNLDEPLVLALDGPWGSGKSVFVRQWAGLLRQRGVPTALFDAFANDHQEDAFIALAGEIAAFGQSFSGGKNKQLAKFIESAKKAGRVLLPATAKVALRAATLGALAAEDMKDLGDSARQILASTSADTGVLAEKVIEERLDRAHADRRALETFRESLQELAADLTGGAGRDGDADGQKAREAADAVNRGPLVFIIDELDRCKPTFALSLLERVKHLFSVEGVCFVLVTHVPQLEAVVRGAYGSGVAAEKYLEKFLHLRVALPDRQERGESVRQRYIAHLWNNMGLNSGERSYDQSMQRGLLLVSEANDLSLRTIERVAALIALVYAASSTEHLRISALVLGLCVMRQVAPNLYAKAKAGTLAWSEIEPVLRLDQWGERNQSAKFYDQWWRYATVGGVMTEDRAGELEQYLARYGVNRSDLLPVLAEYIDELRQTDD